MLRFLAAVLAGTALAAGAADAQVANLPGVFQATCLDGQAKFRANEVSAISFDRLPAGLRQSLGQPASGKVWQLNGSGQTYLYMLDYQDGSGGSRVCGLASDAMDLKTAGDLLESRVTGSVARTRSRSAQWLNAKEGYVATATTAAALNVLQISWLSEAEKVKAQQQVERLPH